jgi:hypothetical protein
MKREESIKLTFDLYIKRQIIEDGYPHIMHITVVESVDTRKLFYNELTRISKKYSSGG